MPVFILALFLLFLVSPASAVVRFVDGACLTSGTGATLTCGATGPFRTIAEGIAAILAGDRVNVRGAHDSFNGIYFEQLAFGDGFPGGVGIGGDNVDCASSQCVLTGCRVADGCPANEVPTVRGMTTRT